MDRGIPNLGNTCYLNSILQCLRYSEYLVCPLLKHDSSKDSALHANMVDLLFASAPVSVLKAFVQELSIANPEFRLLRQCDSHELFIYLMDSFFTTHKQYKNPYEGRYDSFIACQTCQHVSKTSYPFVSVSVEMELGKVHDVETLLTRFSMEERLDDKITCDLCKTKRESTKRIEIGKAGKCLAIHLKRFQGSRKICTPVRLSPTITVNGDTYILYAISNHMGSVRGGHYTAAVKKKSGEWMLCNDSFVTSLNCLPAQSAEAYVLFYVKK